MSNDEEFGKIYGKYDGLASYLSQCETCAAALLL